jgi:hypothetical protein
MLFDSVLCQLYRKLLTQSISRKVQRESPCENWLIVNYPRRGRAKARTPPTIPTENRIDKEIEDVRAVGSGGV